MSFEINSYPDLDAPVYSIGVVAELLHVSVHTLRLYENEGLIIPYRKDSKHRLYSQNDLNRLRCIRESITNKKFSIASIKTLYSMIPCWDIRNCSEFERQNCSSYKSTMEPCWTSKHENNICENDDCRTCTVYTKHTNCDTIKDSIRNISRFK
jgi:MerR family transcriptional regulator/heat shock protein HspR